MEKHFLDRKKRRNGKEKRTETKGEKKRELVKRYENLNTENCLNQRLRLNN